ncbi:hypothetical protein PHYPSEUDO_013767 [Phytophthora pseudosyringae]|uniref:Uncharacterized protein n=1 Tax=Phytophthora pseudosyringae TaxID=221518 RepID=A0A8T1V4W5_9STRA|nr:hypothetical protein PHYPSEUDO_013767 [Phytophthora pseudosyringae]
MPATAAPAAPAPVQAPVRAPPPPVPTSAPVPAAPEQEQEKQPATEPVPAPVDAADPPTKRKQHRGLIRAIGGLFKRKCSDADDVTAPSDSEASQRRTSRWSRWSHSHRQSLPEAPLELAAVAAPETAPIQENESAASSPHMEEPPTKKSKAEKPKKDKKTSFQVKQSPTDPSELLAAESSDESGAEPQRVSFLFFGGSDADSTFQPELRPSELDDLHENAIRPSLQAKMPLFFSPPLVENLRRSSILPDPQECGAVRSQQYSSITSAANPNGYMQSALCELEDALSFRAPAVQKSQAQLQVKHDCNGDFTMGVSGFFQYVWDLVRRPFENCTSCCDVLDPDYYRKTSPGVRRTSPMFNRWEHDVKYNLTPSRPPSQLPPFSSSPTVGKTQGSREHQSKTLSSSGSRSGSRSDSPSDYSYEEEDERQVQFLFYGGSDPPTPTSAGGLYSNGYRSDMISNYVEPRSPAASIESPRISHEMPCFFSPRDVAAQSPMSAPIYSPHLFKITEQRTTRRSAGYYRFSRSYRMYLFLSQALASQSLTQLASPVSTAVKMFASSPSVGTLREARAAHVVTYPVNVETHDRSPRRQQPVWVQPLLHIRRLVLLMQRHRLPDDHHASFVSGFSRLERKPLVPSGHVSVAQKLGEAHVEALCPNMSLMFVRYLYANKTERDMTHGTTRAGPLHERSGLRSFSGSPTAPGPAATRSRTASITFDAAWLRSTIVSFPNSTPVTRTNVPQ